MIDVASRRPWGLACGPALLISALLSLMLAGCRDVDDSQRLELQGSALDSGYHITLYADTGHTDVALFDVGIQSELVVLESDIKAFHAHIDHLVDATPGEWPGVGLAGERLVALMAALHHAWLIDVLAEWFEARGIERYLIEVGGDVRASGRQLADRPWRLALEQPADDGGSTSRLLELDDLAVATMGDFRDHWNGLPSRMETPAGWQSTGSGERVVEVGVVAMRALDAAVWARTLKRMTVDDAMALAERRSIAAYFIVIGTSGYDMRMTSAMVPYLDD